MGYEIAAGLGVQLAAPDREVFVLVGDGSYLMMAQEIVTSIQEGVGLAIVLLDNHGFASIGGLSQSVGCGGFGTAYRARDPRTGELDGDCCRSIYAANAASLGASCARPTRRGVPRGDCRRPASRIARRSSSSRSIASSASAATSRGGTCRSRRSRRWP